MIIRTYILLAVQDVLLFILPAYLIARWRGKTRPWQWLRFERTSCLNITTVYLGICTMVVWQPAINLLADLNSRLRLPACMAGIEAWMQRMEAANNATLEQLLAANDGWSVFLSFVVIALLAAVSEEMLFRGALQGWIGGRTTYDNMLPGTQGMMSRHIHTAIWVTAALFSALHLQFYGFVPRMLMGALFGYVLVWTGTIYMPILMHLTNNTVVLLLAYMVRGDETLQKAVENFGAGETWLIGVVSMVLGCMLITFLYLSIRQCQEPLERRS